MGSPTAGGRPAEDVAAPGQDHRLTWAIAVVPVAATVGTYGELSPQAFVAVSVAGTALMVVGLRRGAGAAAPPVRRAALGWLGWLVAVALWELWTRLHDAQYPTLSDLMDPVLAHHVVRALATVVWLAAGGWLVRRPAAPRPVAEQPARDLS